MRDYIKKHIIPSLEDVRQRIRERVAQLEEEETFTGSIVPGSVTNRQALKNCMVFGEAHVDESAKMVNCVIAAGATVYVGANSTVTDTMFGTLTNEPCIVHIGSNVSMNKSMTIFSLDIGDGSVVTDSSFGDPGQHDGKSPQVSIGKNALLTNTIINLRVDYDDNSVIRFSLGDGAVVLKSRLHAMKDVQIGSDFLCCDYDKALPLCLGGTVSTAAEAASPTENTTQFYRDIQQGMSTNLFYTQAQVGDNFYLGISTRFLNNEAENAPGLIFGNDVYVLPGDYDEYARDRSGSQPVCTICAETLRMDDGSTLVLEVPGQYENQRLKKLHVKAGATLFYRANEDSPQYHFSGNAITVNKNAVIEL